MRSQWPRRVIPRWRSASTSAGLLESIPHRSDRTLLTGRVIPASVLNDVKRQIDDWERSRDLGVGLDLLSFGHINELRPMLAPVAEEVLQHPTLVTAPLRRLAVYILGQEANGEVDAPTTFRRREIARLRIQLRSNPKNPLSWVDLARAYAINGQNQQASKAVQIALSLAPNHRFVLRSATRFFLHAGEPERALSILKGSARTTEDPWLLASMISVEAVLDRAPAYFKKAKQIIEGERFAPIHLAELGTALGTLQMNAGNARFAKRTFNTALQRPNDNAVAQAVWVANEYSLTIRILPEWLVDQYSSEANYYALERAGDYRAALSAACNWFDDEPFSTRPLRGGAFVASILGKYEVAQDQMEQALALDPDDLECKNNLVFALAGQNKLEDAYSLLLNISHAEVAKSGYISGHTVANWGMLYYRQGDFEQGRKLYQEAHEIYRVKNDGLPSALALAFWVQEAKRAQDPTISQIIEIADKKIAGDHTLAARTVLRRAVECPDTAPPVEKPLIRNALTWKHDKERNVLIVDRALPFPNAQDREK